MNQIYFFSYLPFFDQSQFQIYKIVQGQYNMFFYVMYQRKMKSRRDYPIQKIGNQYPEKH
jgi:hypothetical protein